MKTIHQYFKEWCKLTKRSGGVLLGSSLKQFFDWYTDVVETANKPTCNGNCGMNYCDDNGCIDRKRELTTPTPLEK